MSWKTIEHLNDNVEINHNGLVRFIDSKKEIQPCMNLVTGYYIVNIRDKQGNSGRRNIHTLVARYFLNNGLDIDKKYKVVFKNGDLYDYSASNLAIIDKYQTYCDAKNTKKEILINYGDEIYC
jgi:hypothetical protein